VKRRISGFSLLELSISFTLLSFLLLVLGAALSDSQRIWRDVWGANQASSQLKRACAGLQREIALTNQVYARSVPAHLAGGGWDGDAIWFTSATDPATGQIARKANGSPLYLRNILYYLIVPRGHAGIYGFDCAGGIGPNNYDDRCPHKVLVRKVIDYNGPSSNESNEEQPMSSTEVAAFLTQPNGLDVSSMTSESTGGAQVGPVQLVARDLLWLTCNSKAPASPLPVQLELRASNLLRVHKELAVGRGSLYSAGTTEEVRLSLMPGNH